MEEIQNLIYCQEEPFGGLSIFAQRSVFRLAKEHHIKVLLDGQGADEVLAGYPPYISLKLLSLIRTGRWKNTYQLWSSIQNSQNNPYQDFILPLIGNLVPRRMQYTLRQFIKADISPEWLSTKWFIDRGVKVQPLIRSVRKDALRGELERAIYETSLPMLLRYEDKNSMFFSIESRVPFLTPDFVNLALSLPEEYLVDINGVGKAVFRAAMKDLVPKPILDRRDKIGFAVPENEWLRSKAQWVQAVFKSEVIHEIPILKWDKLNSIFSQMLSSSQPVSGEVWRWINVVLWADIFNVGFSS
jgi:asparagine synthase (glutamine-hydrolysing)